MFQTLSLYVPVTLDHCQVYAHLYNNMHAGSFMLWCCKLSRKARYYFYYRKIVNSSVLSDEPQKFLHSLPGLPIYSQPNKQLTTVQCIDILLQPDLSQHFLCSRVPFDINCNSVYVVDMTSLIDPRDVVCDDMGAWKWKGSYRRWISVDEIGWIAIIGKELSTPQQQLPHYRIWKRYYENKSSNDLSKMVVTMEGNQAP